MSLLNDIETKVCVADLSLVLGEQEPKITEVASNNLEKLSMLMWFCDRAIRRSKGFGFVTFREDESTTRTCQDPNPTIDGQKASCKLAYLVLGITNQTKTAQSQESQNSINYSER
ncbi:hypothetical protein N665_0763s0012 [Sinapis alba]|nr:hypothetical protein N665_0763s0012 [Sinapis alba]